MTGEGFEMGRNESKKNRTHRRVKVVLGLALLFALGALASGALATDGSGTTTETTATETTTPATTDTTTPTDTTAPTDTTPTDTTPTGTAATTTTTPTDTTPADPTAPSTVATCAALGTPQISADYSTGSLHISGSGFAPVSCSVTIRISDPSGAASSNLTQTDLTGSFSYDTVVSGQGLYTIDALGFNEAPLASTSVTLTLAGPAASLIVKLASGLSSPDHAAVIARDCG